MVPDIPYEAQQLAEDIVDDGTPVESFLRPTSNEKQWTPPAGAGNFRIEKTGSGLETGIAIPLLVLMVAFEFWAMLNGILCYMSWDSNSPSLSLITGIVCLLQVASAFGVGAAYIKMKRQGAADIKECYSIAGWTGGSGLISLNILAVGMASVLFVNAKASE